MIHWLKRRFIGMVGVTLHSYESAKNPVPRARLTAGDKVEYHGNDGKALVTVHVSKGPERDELNVDIVTHGLILTPSQDLPEMLAKHNETVDRFRRPDLQRPGLSAEAKLYLRRASNDLDCAVQLGAGDEIAGIEARLDELSQQ